MPKIEEVVKYTLEEPVSIRSLVQAAMDRNSDDSNIDSCKCSYLFFDELLDSTVYAMSNNGEMPGFYIWAHEYIYFPCQNDMGVKWIASVPRIPHVDTALAGKVLRV